MAASVTSAAAPMGAISIFRSVQFVTEAVTSFSTWNSTRATRNSLGKLSDRELDDIGLCRGDIDTIGR